MRIKKEFKNVTVRLEKTDFEKLKNVSKEIGYTLVARQFVLDGIKAVEDSAIKCKNCGRITDPADLARQNGQCLECFDPKFSAYLNQLYDEHMRDIVSATE